MNNKKRKILYLYGNSSEYNDFKYSVGDHCFSKSNVEIKNNSKLQTIERCYTQLKFIKIPSSVESKKKKSYIQ